MCVYTVFDGSTDFNVATSKKKKKENVILWVCKVAYN